MSAYRTPSNSLDKSGGFDQIADVLGSDPNRRENWSNPPLSLSAVTGQAFGYGVGPGIHTAAPSRTLMIFAGAVVYAPSSVAR